MARQLTGKVAVTVSLSADAITRVLENLKRDVAYAARTLRRSAGFSIVAIMILAIGIGANTTIFRFVSALLLQPPPVRQPDQLLQVWNLNERAHSPLERYVPLTYPDYAYYRDHSRSFSGLLAFDGDPTMVSWMRGGHGEMAQAQYVSGNYFSVLGVRAIAGTATLPPDEGPTSVGPTVVISYRFWRDRLGSDPKVIGSIIDLNGETFAVAGVAPPGFTGLLAGIAPDVWVPLASAAAVRHDPSLLSSRSTYWLLAVGRLHAGATEPGVRSDLELLAGQLAATAPPAPGAPNDGQAARMGVAVAPETLVPAPVRLPVSAFLALLQIVVLMILLIACANAANLFLAQAIGRRPEMLIRSALGASRGRLVQLVLAQTLLLSLIAGAAGCALAQRTAPLMLTLVPRTLPVHLELSANWRVVVFGLVLALAAGVVFGLAPALRTTGSLTAGLGRQASAGRRTSRLRGALVVTQVALSLVLLVSGALCWQSLMRAQHANPGFIATNRIAAEIDLRSLGYSDSAGRVLQRRLFERVSTLPGVRHVSTASYLPLATSRTNLGVAVPGVVMPGGAKTFGVQTFDVGPGYFETMGTPLLRGREFGNGDDERSPRVAIVNEAMARRFWPDGNALGKVLTTAAGQGSNAPYEIVGVVATGKYRTLGESPTPVLFRAERQTYHARLTLVADIDGGQTERVLEGIRQDVAALDPNLVVVTGTLDEYLGFALFPARASGWALGIAGGIGLLLALAGIAAVIAQSVAQRTREIGIRMALGAQRRDILAAVLGEGSRLLAIGIAIGALVALGATRVLSGILYGISPSDPLTFAGMIALLAGASLGACLLVARRATEVDPITAMRAD